MDYHRVYKFGNNLTKHALNISHGKSRKTFLMDLASNNQVTEKEWARYEKTVTNEKEHLITIDQVKKLKNQLENIRSHKLTNVIKLITT